MRRTVVTSTFSADHIHPFGSHRHGHDFHVRAAFRSGKHKAEREAELDGLLSRLDHGLIDDHIREPSNEGIAEWIGKQLGCLYVYVWRYEKGREFGGEWEP